jgi:hypothetical protein
MNCFDTKTEVTVKFKKNRKKNNYYGTTNP